MILTDDLFLGRPILSLQTMLREISFQHRVIPRVVPDGVFGEQTLEAIMVLQREFSPPVTGRVDSGTWDTVARMYHCALRCRTHPRACTGYPSPTYTVAPGAQCVHLYLIQSMFQALSHILEGVEHSAVTGRHDGASVGNTRWIQRLNGQPETGIIDMSVWDALTRLYTIFVTYAQSPWLSRGEVLGD